MTELEKAAILFSEPYPENDCVRQDVIDAFESGAEWQANQSPWISVEVRLPEHDNGQSLCEVLVKACDGRFHVTANICVEDMAERGEVTHWLPIPE